MKFYVKAFSILWFCQLFFLEKAVSNCDLELVEKAKSFNILPTQNSVIQSGMYKYIRHPLYFGYLLIVLSKYLTFPSFFNLFVLLIFLILTELRIQKEENIFSNNSDYLQYKNLVKFKIIPWVY
ncbi:MAG: hypothetical protein H6625_00435 [Bdellovibrionaceae bacterium]|nr:hypothetical protein [Pseudobdellovibrionaceae bacterium]